MKVFRTPRTQNERAQTALLMAELRQAEVKIKFRTRYLPSEWDDIRIPFRKYPNK